MEKYSKTTIVMYGLFFFIFIIWIVLTLYNQRMLTNVPFIFLSFFCISIIARYHKKEKENFQLQLKLALLEHNKAKSPV